MALNLAMPILVIDDQATVVRIIRALLRQIGFRNIDHATDGSSALALLRDKPYRLILSDWRMKPMDGYELLKIVRSHPDYAGLPFIMISVESRIEQVMAAKAAGVSSYIIKPFSARTLRSRIEAVFA